MLNTEQEGWKAILAASSRGTSLAGSGLPSQHAPLTRLYAPVLERAGAFVIAHLAQSLDGCVALHTGESQWITGTEDLLHTHRLRALVDAVVVGVQTVIDDDPKLNVRHCEGPDPVRVVLDPRGRGSADRQVFSDGRPTLRLCEVAERDNDIALPTHKGVFDPRDVLAALRERGLHKVLVEGGGVTVSHFLMADCVDRLHLVVAPVLLGGGRPSFPRPMVNVLADARRFGMQPVQLGPDWLFDCDMA